MIRFYQPKHTTRECLDSSIRIFPFRDFIPPSVLVGFWIARQARLITHQRCSQKHRLSKETCRRDIACPQRQYTFVQASFIGRPNDRKNLASAGHRDGRATDAASRQAAPSNYPRFRLRFQLHKVVRQGMAAHRYGRDHNPRRLWTVCAACRCRHEAEMPRRQLYIMDMSSHGTRSARKGCIKITNWQG